MKYANTDALLREVAHLYEHAQRKTAACCDNTTHTQCLVLTAMGRSLPMTPQQLADTLGFEKSWMSRVIERLVSEGLIVRSPNTADGRSVLLSLTSAGQERLDALNITLNSHADRVMSHIPPRERDSVRHALTLLRDALRAEETPELLPVGRRHTIQLGEDL
ncbi:MAG: MarR family transcriptional regulator [Chloroflexi bacterium]|nr:MarR family transcriptional regulator [Chloroflexota bacterium]